MNLLWGDESSTRKEVEPSLIREHTVRVSSVSSVPQLNIPSNVVPEDIV
jgi:hypothetical protein